jgi:predicted GIY-YIG superfamily endonuclease
VTGYDGKPDPGRTALYRLYDAAGQLLYVGISIDPPKRVNVHRWEVGKKWRHDIAHYTEQWFDTRVSAEAAEVATIRTELPLHNRRHRPTYDDAPWSSYKAS